MLDVCIRRVCEEDIDSLQRNCFSANTVEQTTAIVRSAIADEQDGEAVLLVAVEGDEEVVVRVR